VTIWYIFPDLECYKQEKSGNPAVAPPQQQQFVLFPEVSERHPPFRGHKNVYYETSFDLISTTVPFYLEFFFQGCQMVYFYTKKSQFG
jgi:hypothetical protein